MSGNPHIDAVIQAPLLTAGHCDGILARAASLSWQVAEINAGAHAPQARRCQTASLAQRAEAVLGADGLSRLLSCVHHWNARCWRFALDGGLELNVLRYRPGDHYHRWHTDLFDDASTRKLSFTVQLSADYEGGTLQMQERAEPCSRRQGDIVLFPAFLPHRVEPVTAGERLALVGWMHGPPFR